MHQSGLHCPNITTKTGYFYFSSDFQDRRENSPQADRMQVQPFKDIPSSSHLDLHLYSFFIQINEHVFTTEYSQRKSDLCAVGLAIDGKAQCVHISLYQPCAWHSILDKISAGCQYWTTFLWLVE